ncbi:MAG: GatB/YqeY domain-containing protein, partial [bacterium]|nr:GatB/YqeY domain-containing protein [bacterium]
TLRENINADIKTAMKSREADKLTTLRGLIAVLNNKEIEKRAKTGKEEILTDDEMLQVVMSEAKKRKDAIELFKQGGRQDLVDQETKELAIIAAYLPKQLSASETESAIESILSKNEIKEFGPAMKVIMAELRGKADAALVTEIVKKKLG